MATEVLQVRQVDRYFSIQKLNWQYFMIVFGVFGGFLAMILGLFLTVILHISDSRNSSELNTISNILVFIALPMIFSGIHFLDKANAQKPKSL